MGRIIGIDLGTTNSLTAYWEDNSVRLIPNALGEYLTPSVVSIDKNNTVYVGKIAKERMITHPESTASIFKRSMGTERLYNLNGKWYSAEELSAMVLRALKDDAEKYLGETVEEAIISVPAYFNDIARQATRKAGQLAGLKVERIINEPSAAALASQHANKNKNEQILVFDFGGGTLDVSLVEVMGSIVEIQAVSGDNRLGGSDFDKVIAQYFCRQKGFSFGELNESKQGIVLKAAEKVKRFLSYEEEAVMRVAFDDSTWELSISRKTLIQISGSIFKRISAPIKRVLSDGAVSLETLDQIVMVGGSSKMPVVQQYLRFMMKNTNIVVENPDHMIALGVGIFAGMKERDKDVQDMILTDICPFSLGCAIHNEANVLKPYMSVMIPRNSTLPSSCKRKFYTASDNQSIVSLEVFQGEDMYVENNLLLGSLNIKVPAAPKGEICIEVCFTYDINGLLVVDVYVPATGEKKQMIFMNGKSVEADETIKQQMKQLEKLAIAPKEDEENKLLLERAEALYSQLTGAVKMELFEKIKIFNHILSAGSKIKVKKAAKGLLGYVDMLEKQYLDQANLEDDLDEFEKWFTELEEADELDELEDLDDWGKIHYTS